MNDHHLILGKLTDFVTGHVIDDTHDERYRQKIARILIEKKGYRKADITPQYLLHLSAGEKCARVPVTFVVAVDGQPAMLIHYGPGSLVTRQRPALAMAKLIPPHQLPVVVVSNGEDAEILDVDTGKVVSRGLENIPEKTALAAAIAKRPLEPVSEQKAQRAARIVIAFEVDDRCPCDDTACLVGGV